MQVRETTQYKFKCACVPCKTRWLYNYLCIKRLVQTHEAIDRMCTEFGWTDLALNQCEWNHLTQIETFLAEFYDFVLSNEVCLCNTCT